MAEAWCARLQGDPDILESDLGSEGVEYEWTDGVFGYRSWVLRVGGALLELDYFTAGEIRPGVLGPDEVEDVARALVSSIQEG